MKRATRVRVMLVIIFICIVYALSMMKGPPAPAVDQPQNTTERAP